MGRGCQPWAAHSGSLGIGAVGDGHWLMLTGGPSPDVNMALVHDGDAATLGAVRQTVEDAGYATLMMLAGPEPGERTLAVPGSTRARCRSWRPTSRASICEPTGA